MAKVTLLYFSQLQDLVGLKAEVVELPSSGLTVENLLRNLYNRYPGLDRWDPSILVAINQSFAKRTELIPEGAEVALMPPLSGG
jgi:molybdopterin converting factor subunit 1